ncbi:hypothetical protein ACLOJK_035894 [Asimina triloba]
MDATRTLSGDKNPLHCAEATILTPLHRSGVLLVIPDNIIAPHSDSALYSPRLRFWGVRHRQLCPPNYY